MGFVANFIRFRAVQKFENRLRSDKVMREFKGGNIFETQCVTHQCCHLTTRAVSDRVVITPNKRVNNCVGYCSYYCYRLTRSVVDMQTSGAVAGGPS